MSTLRIQTASAAQTKKVGKILGSFLKAGQVLALRGELGAGKTTLAQGIAEGLGVSKEQEVASPTFVIMHEYQGREKIFHLDWYRLKKVTGADEELALECFESPAVTLVEWPERGYSILPENTWNIELTHEALKKRKISIVLPLSADKKLVQRLRAL